MATAFEDVIRDSIHCAHEELWKMSERPIVDENLAEEAEQLRRIAKELQAIALVCDLFVAQQEAVA